MTIYYIDPTAGVNGTGTEESPFNTWASVTWAYGNEYLQKGGTVWNETILISPPFGAVNKSDGLVVGAYGTGKAIVDGSGTAITAGIKLAEGNAVGYVTIQDFEIRNINVTGDGEGIDMYCFSNPDNNIIKNCYIHDVGRFGIKTLKTEVVIEDNTIVNCGEDCIRIQGDPSIPKRVLIQRNTINYPGQRLPEQGDCIQVIELNYQKVEILNNAMKMANPYKQLVMLAGDNQTDIYVIGNTFDGEGSANNGVSCAVARKYIVKQNYIKDLLVSGINAFSNHSVEPLYIGPVESFIEGNIIVNCGYGVSCSGDYATVVKDININNNTIINCAEAFRFYGRATITAKNNIVGAVDAISGQCLYLQSTIDSYTEDYNIYWPEFTGMIKDYRPSINAVFDTLAAYLAHAEITDSNSLATNPDLDANQVPLGTSPCLGTGTKWWGNNARPTSFNGEPIPDISIDIGAVQSTIHEFHPTNL